MGAAVDRHAQVVVARPLAQRFGSIVRSLRRRAELIDAELPDDLDPNPMKLIVTTRTCRLDPYAAHDEAEYFARFPARAFFVEPNRLHDAFPDWYALLAQFFLQDPLAGGDEAVDHRLSHDDRRGTSWRPRRTQQRAMKRMQRRAGDSRRYRR